MKIFLGIDLGSSSTGFSISKVSGEKIVILSLGVLRLSKFDSLKDKINIFYNFLEEKVEKFEITTIVLEKPFLGKNVKSFSVLENLRGVVLLLSAKKNKEILEFTPKVIKKALTRFGDASKEQVCNAIKSFFPTLAFEKLITNSDLTDAVAISLTPYLLQNMEF